MCATLSPTERTIIELVSASFDGETLSNITRAAGKLGCRSKGRALKNAEVRSLLQDLTERGLLADEPPYSVAPALAHRVMLELAREGRVEQVARVLRTVRPARKSPDAPVSTWGLAQREVRLDLYGEQWEAARALLRSLPDHVLYELCRPFDRAWVTRFPADLRKRALKAVVERSLALLEPANEAFAMLEVEGELSDAEHRVLVEQLMFRGRLEEAEHRLAQRDSIESEVGRAFLLFLRGRIGEAVPAYEAALARYLKRAGKRATFFPDRAGFFFAIALIGEGSASSLKRAATLVGSAAHAKYLPFQESHRQLSELLDVLERRKEAEELLWLTSEVGAKERDPIEILVQAAAILWAKVPQAERPGLVATELNERLSRARAAGYPWYAAQAAAVLAGLSNGSTEEPQPATAAKAADAADADAAGGMWLARLVAPRERWPEAIDALLEVASQRPSKKPATKSPSTSDRRLVWMVRQTPYGLDVEPREQTSSRGVWSKGKPVALKRLYEQAKYLPFLTDTDRVVCSAIETETTYEYGRYARVRYFLDLERALLALAGSSCVLIEQQDGAFVPCDIRQAAPRLEVVRKGSQVSVSLLPRPAHEKETMTSRPAGARAVEVVEFAPVHHAIARALGKKPLVVPKAGHARLHAALEALSSRVPVHSDLSTGEDEDVAAIRAESRLYFVLRPLGDGLSVAAQVRPLGPEGPMVRPGQGGTTVLAQVSGRRARAVRDLEEERLKLDSALAACPALSVSRSSEADFVLSSREQALAALVELHALGGEVTLEWPEGECLRVSEPVGMDSLRLSIKSDAGSFLARGGLTLPSGALADHEVLNLPELLDYLSVSPGRFLRLAGDERYLALTAELRTRLDEVSNLGERCKRGLRVPSLAASLVTDLLASARTECDAAWRRQVDRFTASDSEATVPTTFRGELRPYQLEGFRWLARLGRWGAGGCLADDMGLGKTVQTIALLLQRAPEGPSLVVAPSSVVPTWIDEIGRFAPTLRAKVFLGSSRAKELKKLDAFDVLVTSYTLLQADIGALGKLEFATAVLDEAQAIKNVQTKRARAALRLRAELRLATTGTPIENRLEDLHSLFSFLNPGLLGSQESFQARFVRPIEQDGDPRARQWLRRLVAPFLLRRTKTQVLPELPARIETTLRVPLELEEMALYEAVREQALAELCGEGGSAGRQGPGRIRILAALTRLRLAASNARLVLPDAKVSSAKLTVLGELLDDLLPNRHKLLVFSQFVSHLALVRELLDERGVRYQYLDGRTSTAARKAAVDAFQAGQGEVFLISLKAGGFGLNLTAADYVVHMDPWWNPAVEAQASDRAHRIGQSRPVTIYRLVARDTIEDRILALHHRKQELANGILAGSDLSGRMSEMELLELIRGNPRVQQMPRAADDPSAPYLDERMEAGTVVSESPVRPAVAPPSRRRRKASRLKRANA